MVYDERISVHATVDGELEAVEASLMKRCGTDVRGQVRVLKRAIDARKRRDPAFVYTVLLENIDPSLAGRLIQEGIGTAFSSHKATQYKFSKAPDDRPLVVGAGPAGLFAALMLAEAGWPPIILERGESVEERPGSVATLYSKGELNPESNVCFGEGGAGTFSDGKLYTRIGDSYIEFLLARLVEFGAPSRIRVHTRPHVGTDKLIGILKSMRQHLQSLGAEFHFNEKLEGIRLNADNTALRAVETSKQVLDCRAAILATGHSARDVWGILNDLPAILTARPFAVGYRIEHPQQLIDEQRYGFGHRARGLPAADYRLRYTEGGRGVYSFCMCPGGVVVATPTTFGALVTNGMSHASRSGKFANSALVVTVNPDDFMSQDHGVFSGAVFQRRAEEEAYLRGGGAFVAPALRLSDYVAGKLSHELPATSYRRGLHASVLDGIYPPFVDTALRHALQTFEKRMRGFITQEAKVIAAETRTASPIRVERRPDGQAEGIDGLYPAGEGMGYGGGIVSAAVDGMRAAEALLQSRKARGYEVTLSLPDSLRK